MNRDHEFEFVTTEAVVVAYESSAPIFQGILSEVRELSKKKPEATMSASKVRVINRVLSDLLVFLKTEPSGKYLDLLDDEALPQMSDAVLAMVQFETALKSFKARYRQYDKRLKDSVWITTEFLENFTNEG